MEKGSSKLTKLALHVSYGMLLSANDVRVVDKCVAEIETNSLHVRVHLFPYIICG
jgi:hypothetical protein